jgi:tetratricopeptide (TPR) repeat protein
VTPEKQREILEEIGKNVAARRQLFRLDGETGVHHQELVQQMLALEAAVEGLQQLLLRDDSSTTSQQLQASWESVRDGCEAIEDWESALLSEDSLLYFYEGDLDRARSAWRRGKLHMRLQDASKAVALYQEASDLFQQVHGDDTHHADIGNLLVSLAAVDYHRNRWSASLERLQEAKPHFEHHGQKLSAASCTNRVHPDLVKCLQYAGLLYRSVEDFESALSTYQRAVEVLESLGGANQQRRQELQLDIADMHLALEDYEQALEAYQDLLEDEISRQDITCTATSALTTIVRDDDEDDVSSSSALEGVLLHNIGKIHALRGENEVAVQALHRAVRIKDRLADDEFSPEVAKTLTVLGAVYASQGDKARALPCFQRSLLIARANSVQEDDKDPNVMLALRNIAVLTGEKVPKWGASGKPSSS